MRRGPLTIATSVALLGCAAAPPPPLPAGIAELQLPRDSRTLARVAGEDDPGGSLARRREILTDVSRQLLEPPPSDPLVPELFDLLTALAPRMEAGSISPAWGSYVYTSYHRDLVHDRPSGVPRRSRPEVERALDGYVEFFRLRKGRPARTVEDVGLEDMQDWRNERRIGR